MANKERLRLIVVEDFYEQPDEIRAMALRRSFAREDWRPRICDWQECFDHGQDVPALMSRICRILNSPLSYDPLLQGFFRLLSRESYIKLCRQDIIVHIDDYDWSGIICLSPRYDGSIPVYRHKESGGTRASSNEEWDRRFKQDSTDLDRWNLVEEIAIGFNRLVLFDPRCFHFIGHGVGHSKETARLTQQFQFNEQPNGVTVRTTNW